MRRVVVLLVLLGCLGRAADARGDDIYTVQTCAASGPGSGWTISDPGPATNTCPSPGIASTAPYATTQHLGGWTMTFTPPASTEVAGYRLWRTVHLNPAWNYTLFDNPLLREQDTVETCWTIAQCSVLGDGHVTDPPSVIQTGLASPGVVLLVNCNDGGGSNTCGGGDTSNIAVQRFDVDLRDLSDPVFVGTPSGDLLDPSQPVAGKRTVSFSAADQGSGIYRDELVVDGAIVAAETVDDNGGACSVPFTSVVPCRLSASGSLAFDTATLPDGVHAMSLVVTDATETNQVAYGPIQVRTANQLAACEPSVSSRTTPVAAAFKGTSHTAVTRKSGRATIVGKIAGVGAGVPVALISRERRTGSGATILATATTAGDGSYALAVPAGPSRIVHAAWRASPTAATFACSKTLTVRVPASVSLHVSPVRVHPGGRVKLSGKLAGGRIPVRGKLIDLQARELGRWHTFATVRTKVSGAFTAHYRFHSGAPRRTYPMRVRVRSDASYPYGLGYSRSVDVRVR
jgi:hypothetical protein